MYLGASPFSALYTSSSNNTGSEGMHKLEKCLTISRVALLQTGSLDQHISGADNLIGKNPKILIQSLTQKHSGLKILEIFF